MDVGRLITIIVMGLSVMGMIGSWMQVGKEREPKTSGVAMGDTLMYIMILIVCAVALGLPS